MNELTRLLTRPMIALALLLGAPAYASAQDTNQGGTTAEAQDATYSENEIFQKATGFFGETSEGLARAIQRVFEEQGRPNAYIEGEEVSGAIGIGVRYGKGQLHRKTGGGRQVYWQGPTIGFDFGADVSKMFILIYNLRDTEKLFQRFPAVDGSFYFIAGVGVNYQQSGDIIQAPIRTGVGLRAGINIGYMHYTKEYSWIPL